MTDQVRFVEPSAFRDRAIDNSLVRWKIEKLMMLFFALTHHHDWHINIVRTSLDRQPKHQITVTYR